MKRKPAAEPTPPRANERTSAEGIAEASKESPPAEGLEERAYVAILRVAHRLENEMGDWMKQYEVSPTQYNALRILRGAGEAGLPCSEVGARMMNRDPDITRLVDRLAKRGLVMRVTDARDRRVIRARITAAGLELLRTMDRPLRDFVRQRVGPLGAGKTTQLIDLLEGLLEPVSGSEP